MDDKQKPIWKSKTFWVAVLTVILGVLQTIQGHLDSGVALTTLGVINIILRKVTEVAVDWK